MITNWQLPVLIISYINKFKVMKIENANSATIDILAFCVKLTLEWTSLFSLKGGRKEQQSTHGPHEL